MRAAASLLLLLAGCAEGSADGSSVDAGAAARRDTEPATAEPLDTGSSESGSIFVTECEGGLERCGEACANLATDVKHCGACGNACADGESCASSKCASPATSVVFPSPTSTVFGMYVPKTTLGPGGGGRFYVTGDYVEERFARATSATKLTVNFKMSDATSTSCGVGSLTWNVLVNGSVVGKYSWVGGGAGDKTISDTYSFAAIAPDAGSFALRFQAAETVCSGGGSWNWYPGGTATLE